MKIGMVNEPRDWRKKRSRHRQQVETSVSCPFLFFAQSVGSSTMSIPHQPACLFRLISQIKTCLAERLVIASHCEYRKPTNHVQRLSLCTLSKQKETEICHLYWMKEVEWEIRTTLDTVFLLLYIYYTYDNSMGPLTPTAGFVFRLSALGKTCPPGQWPHISYKT